MDVLILICLFGCMIAMCKKNSDICKVINQNHNMLSSQLRDVYEKQSEIIDNIKSIDECIRLDEEKFKQQFEELRNDISSIFDLNSLINDKIYQESLPLLEKKIDNGINCLLEQSEMNEQRVRKQLKEITGNIEIMEEIFRLQLVNSLIEDAEDAIRIYEESVSNK